MWQSSDIDFCVACCPNIAFEHIIICDLLLPPSGAYEVSGGVMVASHCHSWWRWCCDTSLRDTLIMTAVLSCSFWFCWSEHSSYLQSDTLGFSVQYHWLVNYVDILNFRSLYLLLWLADIPRLVLSTVQGQDLGALQGRSWLRFPPVFGQHFYS
jgi:hypothetical protein